MSAHNGAARRLDNIDAMRALAIISVVLFHYTSRWPLDFLRADRLPFRVDYGWAGVDLFFMVSGFCIFMTVERSRTLATFWARRFARLQPSYMVAVLLTFTVVSIAGLPGNEVSVKVALGNLAWLDIMPAWGYVDGAYWSLVAEAEFYFWFGLIFFLMRGRNISLAWAGFAALGSLLTHAEGWGWPAGHDLTVAARSILIGPFSSTFMVGLVCYEFRGALSWRLVAPALLTVALLVTSPRYTGMIWLGLATAAVAAIMFRLDRLRLPKAITFIGLISYSLYLIHQCIGLVIIRELAPILPALLPRIIIAVVTVVGIASLMFVTIELRWQRALGEMIARVIARGIVWLPVSWRELPGREHPRTLDAVGLNREADAARRW